MAIPVEGNWRVTKTTGSANDILPDPLGLKPFVEINPRLEGTTPLTIETNAPDYSWQVDTQYSDDTVLRGTITPAEHLQQDKQGFVIYLWYPIDPVCPKKRIRGVMYRLISSNLPFGEDPTDPGTWEAEEQGDGGEG